MPARARLCSSRKDTLRPATRRRAVRLCRRVMPNRFGRNGLTIPMRLVFATRASALARWQTHWVMGRLQNAFPGLICEEKLVTTQGDKRLDQPLPEIGGK